MTVLFSLLLVDEPLKRNCVKSFVILIEIKLYGDSDLRRDMEIHLIFNYRGKVNIRYTIVSRDTGHSEFRNYIINEGTEINFVNICNNSIEHLNLIFTFFKFMSSKQSIRKLRSITLSKRD